ncbi:hypothetical protein RRV45_16060 [Bacillus sp. DTU_2020_1000418_1_SI_GHA_SEK_038]|uniref:hypothetical protein n=1 Tax=Bacillus sp. DTU_2020_1000418_1_SI_GHA_SEK_038 TaxID=3077585 RepID=UPI0028EC73FC|nr:hypothetical protein [Bacillus sp. DTU_2020_1000418_1_SI_GHA_SEK_038]WNS74412.1 hypothetical protein RRV45_16060 [Bacillus sp. DTU_2020_1000418_1_SI_GHA_SEK_038]
MLAFKGLFIKEIKLTKSWFMVGIGILFFSFIAGLGLMHYFKEFVIFPIISIMILVGHVLYLPAYLINSLNIEGHSQLWLHNPNHGAKLFLAKLSAGFVYFLVSFSIALFITDWQVNHSMHAESFNHFAGEPLPNISLIGIALALSSIYLGIWVLFYWAFYHSLKGIPSLNTFRWPIIIGLWVVLTAASNYIQNLPFYKKLINIGVIKLEPMKTLKFETGKSSASAGLVDTAEISIMNGIIYTAVAAVVFLIAVWLLERKVEV